MRPWIGALDAPNTSAIVRQEGTVLEGDTGLYTVEDMRREFKARRRTEPEEWQRELMLAYLAGNPVFRRRLFTWQDTLAELATIGGVVRLEGFRNLDTAEPQADAIITFTGRKKALRLLFGRTRTGAWYIAANTNGTVDRYAARRLYRSWTNAWSENIVLE